MAPADIEAVQNLVTPLVRDLIDVQRLPGADPAEIVTTTEADVRALGESRTSRRTFAGVDAAELQTYATQEPDWIVQDIFTSDEPLVMGARSKCCKTLQPVDLCVALANGTDWMNTFPVPKRHKVLFLTGEANLRRMARDIAKACRVRGIDPSDIEGFLRVEAVRFPCLPSLEDQAANGPHPQIVG